MVRRRASVVANALARVRIASTVRTSRLLRRYGLVIRRDTSLLTESDRLLVNRVSPFTMTSRERIVAVADAVRYVVEAGIDGAIVECGVWRGGSMMAAALTLKDLGAPTRPLYLYDTYEGMTDPTALDRSVSGGAASEFVGDTASAEYLAVGLDVVRRNMASTHYPDALLHFVVGKVEDSIPATIPERIAVLRLDTDWYESTRHELVHLLPLVAEGGVLILDDYGHWEGSRRAVDEVLAERGYSLFLQRIDKSGRMAVVRHPAAER